MEFRVVCKTTKSLFNLKLIWRIRNIPGIRPFTNFILNNFDVLRWNCASITVNPKDGNLHVGYVAARTWTDWTDFGPLSIKIIHRLTEYLVYAGWMIYEPIPLLFDIKRSLDNTFP